MQDYIGDCYLSNGVEFQRSTYWTLFGRNDHSLVRNNIKFANKSKENTFDLVLISDEDYHYHIIKILLDPFVMQLNVTLKNKKS